MTGRAAIVMGGDILPWNQIPHLDTAARIASNMRMTDMAGTKIIINQWDELFENCASRKLKMLSWVPMPNAHDSVAYCRLMNRKDGPEIFAAWILLVQLASRCSTRGELTSSDGRIYSAEDLAIKTRAPERIFEKAIPYLAKAGWILTDPPMSGDSPDTPADRGRIAALNRMEKNRMEKKTPPTPRNKSGGDLPENLKSEKFKQVWNDWIKHRDEIRKPLKPTQIAKQLKKLSSMGEDQAITAINHTIASGWQGIREPDLPRNESPAARTNAPDVVLKDLERQTNQI